MLPLFSPRGSSIFPERQSHALVLHSTQFALWSSSQVMSLVRRLLCYHFAPKAMGAFTILEQFYADIPKSAHAVKHLRTLKNHWCHAVSISKADDYHQRSLPNRFTKNRTVSGALMGAVCYFGHFPRPLAAPINEVLRYSKMLTRALFILPS